MNVYVSSVVLCPSCAYIRVAIKVYTVTVTRAAFEGGGGVREGVFAPLCELSPP